MLSRQLRPWLVLAALATLGSCDLNPQPPLPNAPAAGGGTRGMASGGTGNGTAGTSATVGPGTGGSLNIDVGGGGTTPSATPSIGGEAAGGEAAGGEAAGGDGNAGAGGGR